MKLITIILGAATLVGIGVYLSRKFGVKNEEDESVIYTEENETYGEKLHKASLFAVGAIRTGADKIAEGIKDIRNQDMVKKGGETLDKVKGTAGDIVEDLKDMVVSINVAGGEINVSDDDIIMDLNAGVADDFNSINGLNGSSAVNNPFDNNIGQPVLSEQSAPSGFFMPNLPEDEDPFTDKF